jgi:hypothetical protein
MTRHLRSARVDRAQYAPASEAADLSRMLDPAYTKRAHSPSGSSPPFSPLALPPRVYVDHDGAMHDPDYRMFPTLPSPSMRKDTQAHAQSMLLSPITPTAPSVQYRRPSWDNEPMTPTTASCSTPQDYEDEQQCQSRGFFKSRARRTPTPTFSSSPRQSFEDEYSYDYEDDEDDSDLPRTPEPGYDGYADSHPKQAELRLVSRILKYRILS